MTAVAAFLCAVLAASFLSAWWVYKLPVRPVEHAYTQRCWWYETPRQGVPPSVLNGRTLAGASIVYHYDLGASGRQIPWRILELATGQVFYWVFRMFGIPWVFLVVGWPWLCAIALGIETRRGFRMVGILTASFAPFLLFVPVLFVAKLAYMFFWIDWRIIQYVFLIHLVLALWPGLTYVRYAMLMGIGRWRRYACAGVTCLVVVLWPIAKHGAFLFMEEYAMGWI